MNNKLPNHVPIMFLFSAIYFSLAVVTTALAVLVARSIITLLPNNRHGGTTR
jgi:hypothetical protein